MDGTSSICLPAEVDPSRPSEESGRTDVLHSPFEDKLAKQVLGLIKSSKTGATTPERGESELSVDTSKSAKASLRMKMIIERQREHPHKINRMMMILYLVGSCCLLALLQLKTSQNLWKPCEIPLQDAKREKQKRVCLLRRKVPTSRSCELVTNKSLYIWGVVCLSFVIYELSECLLIYFVCIVTGKHLESLHEMQRRGWIKQAFS